MGQVCLGNQGHGSLTPEMPLWKSQMLFAILETVKLEGQSTCVGKFIQTKHSHVNSVSENSGCQCSQGKGTVFLGNFFYFAPSFIYWCGICDSGGLILFLLPIFWLVI